MATVTEIIMVVRVVIPEIYLSRIFVNLKRHFRHQSPSTLLVIETTKKLNCICFRRYDNYQYSCMTSQYPLLNVFFLGVVRNILFRPHPILLSSTRPFSVRKIPNESYNKQTIIIEWSSYLCSGFLFHSPLDDSNKSNSKQHICLHFVRASILISILLKIGFILFHLSGRAHGRVFFKAQ